LIQWMKYLVNMSLYEARFKEAPWYEKSKFESILLIGAGGIGSSALYNLVKTIPAKYFVVDPDKVETHNIGTQLFFKDTIGFYKVNAIKETCLNSSDVQVETIQRKYNVEYLSIMISAVDNMAARKQIFNVWKKEESRQILIDGRLRANLYEIYIVTKGKEEEYEKTLFDDADIDDGPCTFKQTAYFGMLIGARITHVLVNYLTNKYAEEPICTLPFKISEFGELFLFETS
jgi:molybdopterin/thiamine biosynthesis adenylyltransferase